MYRWSKTYCDGEEIAAYLRDFSDRFGLRDKIKFGQEIERAEWNESTKRWTISTKEGLVLKPNVFVTASGLLHFPHTPTFEVQLILRFMSV